MCVYIFFAPTVLQKTANIFLSLSIVHFTSLQSKNVTLLLSHLCERIALSPPPPGRNRLQSVNVTVRGQ